MPQDKNERERQGNKENFDRQPQTDRGKDGSKGSAIDEREGKPVGRDGKPVSNDNDIDRAFDDSDDDAITQRNPRLGDRDGE